MKKDAKTRKKAGPKPPEEEHLDESARRVEEAQTGASGEMKALGESISGTQPGIGQKDTGAGRRVPPPAP